MTGEILIVAVGVFIISAWLSRQLCLPESRLRLLDHPNDRSLHHTPTPRTGGLAILVALGAGLLWQVLRTLLSGAVGDSHPRVSLWIFAMVLLITTVSIWDDWHELTPTVRLAVHILAAAGIALGAGLTFESATIPLVGTLKFGWLAIPATILALTWMANLYNFMDGMDGFAGGMTLIGFGFLSYLSWSAQGSSIALVALLTAAAAAGFLVHNRPPARIFMGDVGSMLLGFLAGTLSVHGIHQGIFDWWTPVLIFSPFIVDATVTLLRRLLRGEKVWQAHREHYYQRLVLLGWSHRKTVFAEYVLMLAAGVSAVLYQRIGQAGRFVVLVTWVVVYTALTIIIRTAEQRKKLRYAGLVTEKK